MRQAPCILFTSMTLTGCIPLIGNIPSDIRQAEVVRVTTNARVVKGCTFLGNGHGEIDTIWGGDTNTLLTQLRITTMKLGGNATMMVGSAQTVKQTNGPYMSGEAEAYACQ